VTDSGGRYAVGMNKKPIEPADTRPIFIEVPKPVNKMTKEEKNAFVAELWTLITKDASIRLTQ